MIKVTDFIKYLRVKMPNMRVDGAALLTNAKDDNRLMLDANGNFIVTLFVMLDAFNANVLSTESILESYDERLVIIACIDNSQDRMGKYAQDFVCNLRIALLSVLYNYAYDPESHNLLYVGDRMLDMDRSRYWHRFEFSLRGWLGPEDGVQLNLANFNEYVANWNSSDPLSDNPLAIDDIKPLYDIPT